MMPKQFDDNICVKSGKRYAEYLQIAFAEPNGYRPFSVQLNRYCVPGRIDTYSFDYVAGGSGVGDRVRYFADGQMNLPKSIKLLHEDLDKPQVVKMLAEACARRELRGFTRDLVQNLLPAIAPRSKSLRACRAAFEKMVHEAQKESNNAKM